MMVLFSRKQWTERFCWIISTALSFAAITGCSSHAYRVSDLPVQFLAPSQQNVETANLAGLANTSISSEIIQPGDVLEVTMITDFAKLTTSTAPVRVAKDGTIVAPLIGKVSVAGFDVEQAEQILANESIARGVFRTPNITVTMKQNRTNKVTVVGAVNKPGLVELPRSSSSLLGALVAVEGLSKEAGAEVEIRRTDSRLVAQREGVSPVTQASFTQGMPAASGEPVVEKINLEVATKQGAIRSPELHDGDVVYVPKRVLKPVYVMGLVRKSGEYPYPVSQELRVLDSIALAGGFSTPLAEKILVIRQLSPDREPIRIAVNVDSAKQGNENLVLAPGDTVTVEHTPLSAVGDALSTFIRVGVGASMPLF